MPFYRWQLIAARVIAGYPKELKHLGHHILKRRLDLGWTMKATAKRLLAHPVTIQNWERGRTPIEVRFFPAIVRFLRYNPLPAPKTRGQAIKRERVSCGWSRKHLAWLAGIDEDTVRRLEADRPGTARRPANKVLQLLRIIP